MRHAITEATRSEMVELGAEHGADSFALNALRDMVNDTTRLERYVYEGATDRDIADLFGVREEMLVAQLGHVLRKARAQLRARIRRALFQAADKGDARVLGYVAVKYLEAPPDEAPALVAPSPTTEARRLAAGE